MPDDSSIITYCVGILRNCGVPVDATPWNIEMMYNSSDMLNTAGGSGIDVGFVDTGVLKGHMDLRDRIVTCKNFTQSPVADNDCPDERGHGTIGASILAADGGADGLGMWGVAPDVNLHVLDVCTVAPPELGLVLS